MSYKCSHSIILDIPDGQLVIANNLLKIVGNTDYIQLDYHQRVHKGYVTRDSIQGRIQNTDFWETQGIMFFQSGNSCPMVYINRYDDYIVFRDNMDNMYDLSEFNGDKDQENYIGIISTQLWVVTAMSYITFKTLCDKNGLNYDCMIQDRDAIVMFVEPGLYKCTNYYELLDNDTYGNVYHSMELIK